MRLERVERFQEALQELQDVPSEPMTPAREGWVPGGHEWKTAGKR